MIYIEINIRNWCKVRRRGSHILRLVIAKVGEEKCYAKGMVDYVKWIDNGG